MKSGITAGLARSLARTASDVLGSDSLHIEGGGGVEAILSDINRGEEFPDDVAEPETSLSLVATAEDFEAEYDGEPGSYINALAYYAGETYRIVAISHRPGGFFTISLRDEEQGA